MTASTPGLPADAVEVGRILGAWGVKGWIRVQPYAAEPQALLSSRRWHLLPPDPAVLLHGTPAAPPPLVKITAVRVHGDGVVASVEDVADRSAAEALKGARIFVPRASFPTAGSDEYYWVDLLGLAVVNREGVVLGHVAELIDTGAHSVLTVRQDGEERLIPFVAAYVDQVSLEDRRITVDWGLDY